MTRKPPRPGVGDCAPMSPLPELFLPKGRPARALSPRATRDRQPSRWQVSPAEDFHADSRDQDEDFPTFCRRLACRYASVTTDWCVDKTAVAGVLGGRRAGVRAGGVREVGL